MNTSSGYPPPLDSISNTSVIVLIMVVGTECYLLQDLVILIVTRPFSEVGNNRVLGVLGRDGDQTSWMSIFTALCDGRADSQPYTPVSLRWCRVLCHQRESIPLLMKQKMKRRLQLLITDCREPFIIVSRPNAGTPCLISSA